MSLDRLALLDWLLPHCEPGTAGIIYSKGKSEGPGWANGEADVARAVAAYRAGTLSTEQFSSITQDGLLDYPGRQAIFYHRRNTPGPRAAS